MERQFFSEARLPYGTWRSEFQENLFSDLSAFTHKKTSRSRSFLKEDPARAQNKVVFRLYGSGTVKVFNLACPILID
jgi:hypothetical protein